MKENKDPHHVIMAREMYDSLMELAAVGAAYREQGSKKLAKVRRHVQKYNKPVHVQRQVQIHQEETEYRNLRNRVILLITTHTGDTVWRKCTAPPHPGLTERPIFYLGCKVVGRSEMGKLIVKVRNIDSHELYDVHIEALIMELPEGYTYEERGLSKNIAYDARIMAPRKPYEIKRGK